MTSYLITTKNPEYAGKTFGLKFYSGKAVLSEEMLDPRLELTVEDVLNGLRELPGYSVRPLNNVAQRALEAVLEAESAGATPVVEEKDLVIEG